VKEKYMQHTIYSLSSVGGG